MTDAARPTTVAEQIRVLGILWAAFLIAVIAYTPLPFVIIHEVGVELVPPGVRTGLLFAAAGAAVSSFVARRWWIHSVLAAADAAVSTPVSVDAWARLRVGCIITWALSEVVALIGLAVAVMWGQPLDGLPLSAAAVLLLYYHRPASWPIGKLVVEGESAP